MGTNNLDAVGVSAAGDVEAIVVILAPGPARQDLYCCGRIHIHKTEYVCMYVCILQVYSYIYMEKESSVSGEMGLSNSAPVSVCEVRGAGRARETKAP